MRERARGHGGWRALGRLLPADVRERVFEPAFENLLHHWLTARRTAPSWSFGAHALGTFVGCLPIALPRLFVRERRLTGLGRVAVWSVAVAAVAVLMIANLAESYASSPP